MTLDRRRAETLASALDLDVDSIGICHACLSFVSIALDEGDEREIRRQTLRLTPTLWDEGLSLPLRLALEGARASGVHDAAPALDDVARFGARTTIARAVVRRLALQLSIRTHAQLNWRRRSIEPAVAVCDAHPRGGRRGSAAARRLGI